MKERLRKWVQRRRRTVDRVWRGLVSWLDAPISFASVLVVVGASGWWVARRDYDVWSEMWRGVFIEATGAVMDLVVFGVVIGVVMLRRNRKQQIRTHLELIEDFKKWDSEEARYRIAGAVRRLNRLGQTSIDFVGMEMSEFSFRRHDIKSIAGSKFYAGTWGSLGSREKAVLREVDFSYVDCGNVVFSAFHPLGGLGIDLPRHARFRDCGFVQASLRGATFKGALMEWTDKPPEETGHGEETREGEPVWLQDYYSPFYLADLAGASFEDVEFRNADFRDAENLDQCRFAGAKGLEDCMFDSDEDRELVLRLARGVSGT